MKRRQKGAIITNYYTAGVAVKVAQRVIHVYDIDSMHFGPDFLDGKRYSLPESDRRNCPFVMYNLVCLHNVYINIKGDYHTDVMNPNVNNTHATENTRDMYMCQA
jgi:hypothetical protein